MTNDASIVAELETALNHFDPAVRANSLRQLTNLVRQGAISLPPECDRVNMHCHSFFSFNALGHSPTSLAWLGKQQGLKGMGIIDFDVLDGVGEFLDACEQVGMRGSAGIETRLFIPELADRVINSLGEPGVCYHMGIGFTSSRAPDNVAGILDDLRRRASQRNRAIVTYVNSYLDPVTIDYEQDVLPLTPGGNPTERHLVVAYILAAERKVADPLGFWSAKLDVAPGQMAPILADATQFQSRIRTCLMKGDGVGYIQPDSGLFPSLTSFHRLVVGCHALPCAAWLDGTTPTEERIEEWLGFLVAKGVVALNIIPDRNWNIAEAETRRLKVQNLYHVVDLARQLDLPLNIGTEINSFGQRLVDDLDAAELAPVRQDFVDGAYFIYGHTWMERVLGLGYQSEWAQAHLLTRRERNAFFTRIGYRLPPGIEGNARLQQGTPAMSPTEILALAG